mgnify:CR=1 FL=1
MIDVRRRWGFFCAGAEAPAVVVGVGSTAMVGCGACAPADRLCGEVMVAVGLGSCLPVVPFLVEAVAVLREAVFV